MAIIVKRKDFFKEKLEEPAETQQAAPAVEEKNPTDQQPREQMESQENIPEITPVEFPYAVVEEIRKTVRLLQGMNQKRLAQSVEQAYRDACGELFTVAVVGEFSRGKSTFLNELLGQNVLPVGNLPTTAMLTRIRFSEKNVIQYYDKDGKRVMAQPLKPEAWDQLVADNITGADPQGTVLVGIKEPWLARTRIELMDTPGAGDLEESRARVIGDALLRADGAIITVSAPQALSMSEKLFIEQRLLAKKTPFLMLVLTKLDQVPVRDRARLVDYVHKKLESWKMDIPVFIPRQVDLPENTYQHIMGMDKIKGQILSWRRDPRRMELTLRWLVDKTVNALSTAAQALQEQKQLLDGKEEERMEKIRQKRELLGKAKLAWGELQMQLLSRCTKCQEAMQDKAREATGNLVERLQYEAAMSGNPQKWWQESYPYRLKIELTSMAATLDGLAGRIIAADAKWINTAMEQQFKAHMLVEKEVVADKTMFGDMTAGKGVVFRDIEKQRTLARVGTTVLTVAGAIVCSSMGMYPLIATMGIGTGSSLITERVFKKELEKQRQAIRDAIGKAVPELVEKAMSESDKRLQAVYDDMLREAEKQEQLWMQTQKDSINNASEAKNGDLERVSRRLEEIDAMTVSLLSLT